ncbi:hypothetical protein QBC35DRAFT_440185 [Podospora australis]|uniref:Protein kinase domain-containing protein n=1 Tax=Podospora australis TaxID=1536484 RepID=A0AAN6WN88_9PEZI|nr:hypothetical protein QBC35DRAFT_440185 [Podospora australis]
MSHSPPSNPPTLNIPDLNDHNNFPTFPSRSTASQRQQQSYSVSQRQIQDVYDRGHSSQPQASPVSAPPPQVSEPRSSEQSGSRSEHSEPVLELTDKLENILCQSDDGEYYPHGSLESLLTVDVVKEALLEERKNLVSIKDGLVSAKFTEERIVEYATKICTPMLRQHKMPDGSTSKISSSFCKMFAILVRIRRCWDIVLLVDDEICDANLPLIAVFTGTAKRQSLRLRIDPETELRCFSNWAKVPVCHKDFESHQWATIAPFFSKGEENNVKLYQLSPKDILPWSCVENEKPVTGGYSWVTHVKINPKHHNFDESEMSDGTFAVKHIKATIYGLATNNNTTVQPVTQDIAQELLQDFKREIEILNMFSNSSNKHLIQLLVAFQRGDQCCLVFRWAESDLLNMWKTVKRGPPLQKSSLRWFLEQSRGIVSGLFKIHNFQSTFDRTADDELTSSGEDNPKLFGRHGDIKPENILHFVSKRSTEELGTLVITDFGLCRFHSETSRTYLPTRPHQRTPTYRPPECEMKGAMISRSFDILSLGCVLLEFISWYLGGWELVDIFVQYRKAPNLLMHGFNSDQFFEIVSVGGKITNGPQHIRVKLEVHEFVQNRLHTHPDCSDIMHKLLDFVMKSMLVVEGNTLRGQRANCAKVQFFLNDLCSDLKNIPTLVGTPRACENLEGFQPDAVQILLTDESLRMLKKRPTEVREHGGRTIRMTEDERDSSGRRYSRTSPRRSNTSPSPTEELSSDYR